MTKSIKILKQIPSRTFVTYKLFQSIEGWRRDASIRRETWSSLLQVMACRLFGTEPLPEAKTIKWIIIHTDKQIRLIYCDITSRLKFPGTNSTSYSVHFVSLYNLFQCLNGTLSFQLPPEEMRCITCGYRDTVPSSCCIHSINCNRTTTMFMSAYNTMVHAKNVDNNAGCGPSRIAWRGTTGEYKTLPTSN